MIRHLPCMLVTTLSCLLAFAASASAEGAWLLWSGYTTPGRSEKKWSIMTAQPTLNACSTFLVGAARVYQQEDGFRLVTELYPGVTDAHYEGTIDGHRIRGSLLCLPDTVDPRGPKGK